MLRITCRAVLQPGSCLITVSFRRLALTLSHAPLVIGLAGFTMFLEELRRVLMHLGGLVMNRRGMLVRPDMPALMLFMQALWVIGFAHNPSLSRKISRIKLAASVTATTVTSA